MSFQIKIRKLVRKNKEVIKFTNAKKSNIKQSLKYKAVYCNDAGLAKPQEKNKSWCNIKNLTNNTLSSAYCDKINLWETYFLTSSDTADIKKA